MSFVSLSRIDEDTHSTRSKQQNVLTFKTSSQTKNNANPDTTSADPAEETKFKPMPAAHVEAEPGTNDQYLCVQSSPSRMPWWRSW